LESDEHIVFLKGAQMKKGILLLLVLMFVAIKTLCAAEAQFKNGTYEGKPFLLKDGIYQGEHIFVTVTVTIENGKISGIEMLHLAREKYAVMVEPLIGEIIKKQSTDVDSVTGATASSRNLRKAVVKALLKAKALEKQ
jgi:uncharacterized protein with FMN-binding domain